MSSWTNPDARDEGERVEATLCEEIALLRTVGSFLNRCPYPRRADWLALSLSLPGRQRQVTTFARAYARSGKVDVRELPPGWLVEGA